MLRSEPPVARDGPALLGGFADLFAAALEAEEVVAWRAGSPGALAPLMESAPLARAVARLAGLEAGEVESTLNASFVRLFCGFGGPRGHVPPYESLYCGEGRWLFGESVAEMEDFLAGHGLACAPDSAEPADHLSVELLALAALEAEGDPDAAVLRTRLCGWVPAFAAACTVCDAFGFYADIAAALEAYLRGGSQESTPIR